MAITTKGTTLKINETTVNIKSFPDMGAAPNYIECTTLSDGYQKFVEGVTGMPAEETNPMELIDSIAQLPDDKFHKFMAVIDPDVQRQLTFQLTKEKPEYLTLFPNSAYVNMLSTLMKPDMVKPMVMLDKDTLIQMVSILPQDMLSIVASQIDTKHFAKFLQDGHMDLIEDAWMI